MTMQELLLKAVPDIRLNKEGVVDINPCIMGWIENDGVECYFMDGCDECKRIYWGKEVKHD